MPASMPTVPAEIEQPVALALPAPPSPAVDQASTSVIAEPVAEPSKPPTPLLNPAVAAVRAQPQRSRRPSSFSLPTRRHQSTRHHRSPLTPPTHPHLDDRQRPRAALRLPLPTNHPHLLTTNPADTSHAQCDACCYGQCVHVHRSAECTAKAATALPHTYSHYSSPYNAKWPNSPTTQQQPTQHNSHSPNNNNNHARHPRTPRTEPAGTRCSPTCPARRVTCSACPVKLNNFTLDRLLYGGRGLGCALACCHYMDEQGRQFGSVELLVEAPAGVCGSARGGGGGVAGRVVASTTSAQPLRQQHHGNTGRRTPPLAVRPGRQRHYGLPAAGRGGPAEWQRSSPAVEYDRAAPRDSASTCNNATGAS